MNEDFFPKRARRHRKTSFFARIFPDVPSHFSCIFFQFFLLFPPKCDTCDSKKTTLRLECAHLCAPMRAREKRSPKILPPLFSSFSLLPPSSLPLSSFLILPHFPLLLFWGIQYLQVLILLYAYYRFGDEQRKNAHFLDFFTLWGNIDPYTNRGMRCTPPICSETNDLH